MTALPFWGIVFSGESPTVALTGNGSRLCALRKSNTLGKFYRLPNINAKKARSYATSLFQLQQRFDVRRFYFFPSFEGEQFHDECRSDDFAAEFRNQLTTGFDGSASCQ